MTTTHRPPAEDFETILVKASRNEAAALNCLNQRLLPTLTRFAASRGANDPEAAANQALFDGIRSIATLRRRDETAFSSFLFACVANRVRNEQRAGQVPTVVLQPDFHDVSPAPDPAALIVAEGWFTTALGDLPEDQRAVIIERFDRGATIKETALKLDKTTSSVKHLQARALVRIRRYVLAAGIVALLVVVAIALISDPDQTVRIEPADPPKRQTAELGSRRLTAADEESGASSRFTTRPTAATTSTATTIESAGSPLPANPESIAPADAGDGQAQESSPDLAVDVEAETPGQTSVQSPGQLGPTIAATPAAVAAAAVAAAAAAAPVYDCTDTTVVLRPSRIWPPNKAMTEVQATFSFGPGCDAATRIVLLAAVAIEDRGQGGGDDSTDVIAAIGTAAHQLEVRAAKVEPTRRYVVTWTVTDPSGIVTAVSGNVVVAPPSTKPARDAD